MSIQGGGALFWLYTHLRFQAFVDYIQKLKARNACPSQISLQSAASLYKPIRQSGSSRFPAIDPGGTMQWGPRARLYTPGLVLGVEEEPLELQPWFP